VKREPYKSIFLILECNPALRTFEEVEVVAERGGTWGWWGRDFAKTGKGGLHSLNIIRQVRVVYTL